MFCPPGGFYIDPYTGVDKALITHAHSDHARWGSRQYLAHPDTVAIMKLRLGSSNNYQSIQYGEVLSINRVNVSFHPAGHILGSAQIRVEYKGEVWVAGGDYKLTDDGISQPFETVKCHTFITESTFGLPIYNWQPQAEIFDDIHDWWKRNAANGITSVLLGYSLGKAQRIIYNLNPEIGPIFLHGSIYNVNEALREACPVIPVYPKVDTAAKKDQFRNALIIAPPSAAGSPWLKRFYPYRLGVCSGWMALRGAKRRQAADKGFILSDHADWEELNTAVKETGCEHVITTHGYTEVFAEWLKDTGLSAEAKSTRFIGETNSQEEVVADDEYLQTDTAGEPGDIAL